MSTCENAPEFYPSVKKIICVNEIINNLLDFMVGLSSIRVKLGNILKSLRTLILKCQISIVTAIVQFHFFHSPEPWLRHNGVFRILHYVATRAHLVYKHHLKVIEKWHSIFRRWNTMEFPCLWYVLVISGWSPQSMNENLLDCWIRWFLDQSDWLVFTLAHYSNLRVGHDGISIDLSTEPN